jgi:hypothetical protein
VLFQIEFHILIAVLSVPTTARPCMSPLSGAMSREEIARSLFSIGFNVRITIVPTHTSLSMDSVWKSKGK